MSRRAAVLGGLAAAGAFAAPARALNLPGPFVQPTQKLIGKMTNALLGDIVGPLASGEIVDLLGLSGGGRDKYEHYFQEIENKLNAIQAKLNDIDAKLGQVQETLEGLVSDISRVSEQIADLNVQQLLTTFTDNVSVISANFASYRSAVFALLSPNKADREGASRQLFDLFGTLNAQSISIAMRNIEETFVPRLSQRAGLLDYQSTAIVAAINQVGADPRTWKMPPFHEIGYPNVWTLHETPNDAGVFAYGQILTKAHEMTRQRLNTTVASTLRAYLNVQFQGMLLLSSAWLGTINANQMKNHVERNQQILAAFARFPAAVAAKVDEAVAENVKRFGKALGTPLTTSNTMYWSIQGDGEDAKKPWRSTRSFPLPPDYIMWERRRMPIGLAPSGADVLVLVQRPWEYENRPAVAVAYKESLHPPQEGFGGVVSSIHLQGLGPINVPRFDKRPPQNLAFVNALA